MKTFHYFSDLRGLNLVSSPFAVSLDKPMTPPNVPSTLPCLIEVSRLCNMLICSKKSCNVPFLWVGEPSMIVRVM